MRTDRWYFIITKMREGVYRQVVDGGSWESFILKEMLKWKPRFIVVPNDEYYLVREYPSFKVLYYWNIKKRRWMSMGKRAIPYKIPEIPWWKYDPAIACYR